MEGELFKDCPKCGEECSSINSDWSWDQEPYYKSVVYSFKCEECGCKFTVQLETSETIEVEDEEDDSDAIQKAEQEMEEKATMAMLHQREGTYG